MSIVTKDASNKKQEDLYVHKVALQTMAGITLYPVKDTQNFIKQCIHWTDPILGYQPPIFSLVWKAFRCHGNKWLNEKKSIDMGSCSYPPPLSQLTSENASRPQLYLRQMVWLTMQKLSDTFIGRLQIHTQTNYTSCTT